MPSLVIAFLLTTFSAYAQVRIVQKWQASTDTTELYGIAAVDSSRYHTQNLTRAFLITEANGTISTSLLASAFSSAIVPKESKLRLFHGYMQSIPDLFSNDAWLLWQELSATQQTDTTLCTVDFPITGTMSGSFTKVRGFGKHIPDYNSFVTSCHVSGIVKLNGNDAEITTERTIVFAVSANEFTPIAKLSTANGYYAGHGFVTSHTPMYFQPKLINLRSGKVHTIPEIRSNAGYSSASVMLNDTTLQTNFGRWNFEYNNDSLLVINYQPSTLGVPIRMVYLEPFNAIAAVYYSQKPNIVLLDKNTLTHIAEYTVDGYPTCADVGYDSTSLLIGTLNGMVHKLSIERISSVSTATPQNNVELTVVNNQISVVSPFTVRSLRIYNMLGQLHSLTHSPVSCPLFPGQYIVIVEMESGITTTRTISTH